MKGSPSPDYILVACAFFVMLFWAVLAQDSQEAIRTGRVRGPISRLYPGLALAMAFTYFSAALMQLRPFRLDRALPISDLYLYTLNDLGGFVSVAIFRHMSWYFKNDPRPPNKTWLRINYGSAATMSAVALALPWVATNADEFEFGAYGILTWLYLIGMLALALIRVSWRTWRRPDGSWRAGAFGVAARPDLLVLGAVLAILFIVLGIMLSGAWLSSVAWLGWLMVLFGFVAFLPFGVRTLGSTIRDSLALFGLLAATATAVGASSLISRWLVPNAEIPAMILLSATALVAILLTFQPWLWRTLDRRVLGRSRNQQAALQAFLQTLSPVLGVVACTRRALAELVRVMQLRGAALLFRDEGAAVEGRFAIERLERVWPRGTAADSLISRSLVGMELSELPEALREARMEVGVVAVFEIRGSDHLWGHLLLTADLIGASLREEDQQAIEAFARQLGLLLDGAELLGRAVATERSLAHAEKLAAIGELTARIAHEIRNPLTAARSLTQQLTSEVVSPYAEEHRLILTELERIDRQVTDLLRFARRDEFRFEPLDLRELALETADDLRSGLATAGIDLRVTAESAAHGRGDREKLRQSLLNLIENARDALQSTASRGSIRLDVQASNGAIRLDVIDDGPGIEEDALPHLFEPFFSRKANGTGLGLAIVRRTVEAHGGRIEARRRAAGGMRFRIELPAGDEPGKEVAG